MTLIDQLTSKETQAVAKAAQERRQQQELYTELLGRDALPRKGDAERLANCMKTLGKTAADLKTDLERIVAVRKVRRFAAEEEATIRAEADAEMAETTAKALLESETKRLTLAARGATEAHRHASYRRLRSTQARQDLPAREAEFRQSGLDPDVLDSGEGKVQS